MLLKNLDLEATDNRMLVNGSRGVIVGFKPTAEVLPIPAPPCTSPRQFQCRLDVARCPMSRRISRGHMKMFRKHVDVSACRVCRS